MRKFTPVDGGQWGSSNLQFPDARNADGAEHDHWPLRKPFRTAPTTAAARAGLTLLPLRRCDCAPPQLACILQVFTVFRHGIERGDFGARLELDQQIIHAPVLDEIGV